MSVLAVRTQLADSAVVLGIPGVQERDQHVSVKRY